jgi:hypothetical protein
MKNKEYYLVHFGDYDDRSVGYYLSELPSGNACKVVKLEDKAFIVKEKAQALKLAIYCKSFIETINPQQSACYYLLKDFNIKVLKVREISEVIEVTEIKSAEVTEIKSE